ncbi:MAG: cyclic nucleotide-binding domain-containing protein [Bradymonadaceae bacterium]|nr:cyclic nucleotide-binding domain-containing protein [Lujinxingiaceae bacterium]
MQSSKEALQYASILKAHPLFANLGEADIDKLIAACEPKSFLSGEAIWTIAQEGQAGFLLISGRVETTRRLQPDGQRTQHHSEPGTWLALWALVQGWPHQSSAFALERTEMLRLPRTAFEQMFAAGEPAAFGLVDAIAEDLVHDMRDANRRLHEVFGHPAETLRTLRRRIRTS